MDETLISALFSLAGTLVGSGLGILASNKLVVYRIEQLEKQAEEDKDTVRRISKLETNDTLQDSKLSHMEEEQKRIISDIKAIRSGG